MMARATLQRWLAIGMGIILAALSLWMMLAPTRFLLEKRAGDVVARAEAWTGQAHELDAITQVGMQNCDLVVTRRGRNQVWVGGLGRRACAGVQRHVSSAVATWLADAKSVTSLVVYERPFRGLQLGGLLPILTLTFGLYLMLVGPRHRAKQRTSIHGP